MLMALGQFIFQLPDLAYSELQRTTAWRHAGNPRVGARDALQFVGPGEDAITLSGTLVPEIAGRLASIDTLVRMADTGDAFAMVDGIGNVMGAWVILSLEQRKEAFTREGIARRTDFNLQLLRSDDALVAAPLAATSATIDTGSRAANLA